MTLSCRIAIVTLLIAGTCAPRPVLAAGAHSHGVARLDVAVDGPTITLQLQGPLDSLVGFERAPRNEAERGQVRTMAQALHAGNPFVPTAAARCRLDRVELESAVLAPELLGESGPAAPGKPADDHAELDGTFVYRCEDAKALRGIDVMMFDFFKRLRQVDVQIAGSKGQAAMKLNSRARQIRW